MTDPGRLLSEDEIRALLSRDEGQFLEFKSVWDQEGATWRGLRRRQVRDTIAEYVAAFANADGGPLLLGVEDDGRATRHGYPEEAVLDSLAVPGRRLRRSGAIPGGSGSMASRFSRSTCPMHLKPSWSR